MLQKNNKDSKSLRVMNTRISTTDQGVISINISIMNLRANRNKHIQKHKQNKYSKSFKNFNIKEIGL